ncbi:hypothetical protein [Vibrio quintilis]|uniref:hypothetical protein n=1 Tax=Vibrio quintilis TaxID=1117707 RepID=UPI001160F262|nr:hypothetical protein [Vibrio quintilis]
MKIAMFWSDFSSANRRNCGTSKLVRNICRHQLDWYLVTVGLSSSLFKFINKEMLPLQWLAAFF